MTPARLIWITPDAEGIIGYCARVSSPEQDNPEIAHLLRYCLRKEHHSIFEQANMNVEVRTSRAISAQILRHRSFSFQEFSQRYAAATNYIVYAPRRQDVKNRQSSIDDLSEEDKAWFIGAQQDNATQAFELYQAALDRGIAKECARFLLPMATETKLYMNGTIRSWIHYLALRTGNGTQLEHKEIADAIKAIFVEELPVVSEALGWA